MRTIEPPPAGDATLSTLRVLAMLAIAVGCAPAAVLAEVSADRAPQAGMERFTPESCPYRFDSDMPADTFCVYRGVVWSSADEECATDVVVIWSSAGASQAPGSGELAEKTSASKEIYLGFLADPGLVVRALVDPRQSGRAEIADYTLGSEEAPQQLAGQITLPAVRPGSAEIFSIDLRDSQRFPSGSCAFASYSGTFVGLAKPPTEATTAIEPRSSGAARQ